MQQIKVYLETARLRAGEPPRDQAAREVHTAFRELTGGNLWGGPRSNEVEGRACAEQVRPEDVAYVQDGVGRGRPPLAGRPALSAGADRAWLAVLLVSLLGSAWLLATRILDPWVLDLVGNWYVFFVLLTIPAFVAGPLGALTLLAWGPAERRRRAAVPLLLNALALAVCLYAPLDRPLDLLDFQRHYAAREEVVRRIESGELWSGSALVQVVGMPAGYPRSVSDALGGQPVVQVYREDGALHVVFFPKTSWWTGPWTVFLYRSDGRPPALPNRHLPRYTRSEPLAERWWRVVHR